MPELDEDQPTPANPLTLAERQPLAVRAAATAAVTACVHAAVVLGLPLSSEAETAIGGAVDAVGLLVVVLWSLRSLVPSAKVIARVTTAGQVVAGEASLRRTDAPLPVEDKSSAVPRVVAVSVDPGRLSTAVPPAA